MPRLAAAFACLSLLALSAGAAIALPAGSPATAPLAGARPDPGLTPVAQGCGPGAWRGPWGGCRDTPYTGPLPGGGYAGPPGAPVYYGNGCPPGFWRGPWGHCRDTPYHGPLPGGGWKP
ncbi:GCG_CRPN prefix-to-repeats domain-containing protein [Ancylobacter sp. IITR112]|uniref:GCG_CRPN prefix-to-repeats domain-containing protein n=1 Tax=Ancylobacter sp. IITR112 TaxID=3138073 RepID=UPI00352A9124